jgi:hypothetical protein
VLWPLVTPYVDHIAESPRSDHSRAGTAVLKGGVGGNGSSMKNVVHPTQGDARP